MSIAPPRVQLLRADARPAVPWKNGGGVTRQIAAYPPGSTLGEFDWRISCADVTSPGPFSGFPGIDRILAVLEGELALSVEGRSPVVLSPQSTPHHFPGDVPAAGTPRGACVRDLNVMTRRGRYRARLESCAVGPDANFTCTAATTLIIALAPLVLKAGAGAVPLAPLDALHIEGALACEFAAGAVGACFYRIEIDSAAASG